jgi:signal transduction histidine kinase
MMLNGFWTNTPKLKTRIISLISLILLIQIVIISLLSLFIFRNYISRNAETDLTRELDRTYLSLELLKNDLYNRVSLLRYTIEKIQDEEINRLNLYNIVNTHFMSVNADRIVLLTEDGDTIFSMQKGSKDLFPIEKHIDLNEFRFIKNRYVLLDSEPQELFLITGTKVYHPSGKRYYLFFMNSLDNNFANELFKETGTNFALFAGGELLCSVVPEFGLPVDNQGVSKKIWISSIPYQIMTKTISSDSGEEIILVVLRSTLPDNIYQRRLNTIFLASFLITMLMSVIYAIGVSNSILSPFHKLNQWLSEYLETGHMQTLTIKQKDEIGFLTRTAHSMVQKLKEEEKIIRKQLDEISYLNRYNTEIMQNLKAGVLIIDNRGTVVFSNDFLSSLLNADSIELQNIPLTELLEKHFYPDGEISYFPEIELEKDNNYLLIPKNAGDQELKFLIKTTPLDESQEHKRTLIVLSDITATERLWNKLLITEKVSSMGLLSAGMAHEINNPLGSILSHINYLKAIEIDTDKIDSINWIESETNRIANIVNQVLTFSKTDDQPNGKAEINSVIRDIVEISKYSISNNGIKIEKKLCNEELWSSINRDEFKQVFMNLFLNAAQAIKDHGQISIATSRKSDAVIITITDSGNGIKSENLKNIFNPFFSTKSLKDSSGLGLSITYSILQKVGGNIQISSTPKKGTVVEVTLPVLEDRKIIS